MKNSIWLAGLLAVGMLPGAASAASVTVNFQFSVYNLSPELAGTFSVGQKAVGSFTYETSTPGDDYDPTASGNPLPNFRYYQGALTGFSFSLAGLNFAQGGDATARIMAVANDELTYGNFDYINLIDFAPNAPDLVAGLAASTVSFLFVDQQLTALSSADLPDPFPGIDNYLDAGSYGNLDIFYGDFSNGVRVSLNVESLSTGQPGGEDPTEVSEPATLVMAGSALAAFGLWRRRRS